MYDKKTYIKYHTQWIKYLYRWISYYIGIIIVKTPISPNFITITRIPIVCYAGFLITEDSFHSDVISSVLLFMFSFFDALDGTLAKMKNKHSMMGRWLDPQTDRFGMLFLISSIAYRVFQDSNTFIPIWLSMTTMIMYYHRGMLTSDISYKPKFAELKNIMFGKKEQLNIANSTKKK